MSAPRRAPATKTATAQMPPHVAAKWCFFNTLIDQALAADLKPWSLAEAPCCAIAGEWSR